MSLSALAVDKPEYTRASEEAMKRVDYLEKQKVDRIEGLRRLETARPGPVRHLASAVVSPLCMEVEGIISLTDVQDRYNKRKTELAAESIVADSLEKEGFPKDRIEFVGADKIGFDIRAQRIIDEKTGAVEIRRIEVKGRKRGQPIRLTPNEWNKAHQLTNTYWLYVVWGPLGNSPHLHRVQNPAFNLDHAKRKVGVTGFLEFSAKAVAEAAIAEHGEQE